MAHSRSLAIPPDRREKDDGRQEMLVPEKEPRVTVFFAGWVSLEVFTLTLTKREYETMKLYQVFADKLGTTMIQEGCHVLPAFYACNGAKPFELQYGETLKQQGVTDASMVSVSQRELSKFARVPMEAPIPDPKKRHVVATPGGLVLMHLSEAELGDVDVSFMQGVMVQEFLGCTSPLQDRVCACHCLMKHIHTKLLPWDKDHMSLAIQVLEKYAELVDLMCEDPSSPTP